MEDLLIKWDDLSNNERSAHINDVYTQDIGYVFDAISKIIQKKLIEQNRLILNPAENWDDVDRVFVRSYAETWNIPRWVLDGITEKLTSPPDPKERVVYVGWNKTWPDHFLVTIADRLQNRNFAFYEYVYRVKETIAKKTGRSVSDWEKAREEGKLKGYEI